MTTGGGSGWVDHLHLDLLGEHVLLRSLSLRSFSAFLLSAALVAILCLLERLLTVVLDKNVRPRALPHSRLATAVWRSLVYALVTFLRLLYMLAAMSNQLGVIATVVIALSIGQFAIEYVECRESGSEGQAQEPLLGIPSGRHRPLGIPRARSKPESIFIHPNESNLARADAFAFELGITGDTELVTGNRADGRSWQLGRGREVARKTFGGSHVDPDTSVLDVGDDGADRTP